MTTQTKIPVPSAPQLSPSEVNDLLAEVAFESSQGKSPFKKPATAPEPDGSALTPRQRRKLEAHHEEFAAGLASRLSQFLRTEFTLALAGLRTVAYQQLTESWPEPAHLTLFKTEPLRGVSILEIPTRLGLCLVDRLMGGPGKVVEIIREMSAIENALLEQVAQTVALEWCSHAVALKDLRPVVLGYESSPRFLQTAPPLASMLVVTLEATLGACHENIELAFPFAALEPLVQKLAQNTEAEVEALPAPVVAAPRVWNRCFDQVQIRVKAEWPGLELTAREVLNLKVGDVLRIDPATTGQIKVSLGDAAKFHARLGAVAGKWAVELTETVKT
jgi:flagellar motor switch protein FliM